MSSTRRAKPGSPLKQSKFSSSAEFETGLLANLVARRCSVLANPEDREIVWFLQLLSHREGGIEKVALDLIARFANRIGTKSMLKFGVKPGQTYQREQVAGVRNEFPSPDCDYFPLRSDRGTDIADFLDNDKGYMQRRAEAEQRPDSYPVEKFLAVCRAALPELAEDLKVFCLNPTPNLGTAAPWYFADLPACLREYLNEWVETRRAGTSVTELGQQVYDSLDYAQETKCMVLVEGNARTGKSFAAKAYCEQRPGRARYVQLSSTNDEIGFYRSIAKAIGVSCGLNWKAVELRERIEVTLQAGDLLLVIDESHYLWPNLVDPRTLPTRINWIMTALVNHGVAVALIATPQFLKTQKIIETKTRWTSEQFTGRIGHYQALPETLSDSDLEKVSRIQLPEGDDTSIAILVEYAKASAKYLAGIEAVVRRARFLARRDRRETVSRADIKHAIKDSVIPSDNALKRSLAPEPANSRGKRLATPLQTNFPDSAGAPNNGRAGKPETDLVGEESTEKPAGRRLNLTRHDALAAG